MSSWQRINDLLAPLGIYALGRDGLIDAELAAYGDAFAMVEEMLSSLRQNLDPTTADGDALSLHEAACGLPARPDASEESRRALIALRKIPLRSPSKSALLQALEGCGLISPGLEENGMTVRLFAEGIADGLDPGHAFSMAMALLPAHLVVSAGHTWDTLDAAMPNWNSFDALNRSWNAIALLGAH